MIRILMTIILSAGLFMSLPGEVEAARMGGGKSFGSRPSYSMPYQRSPGSSQSSGGYQNPQGVSPAQARNQGIRDSMAQRGGFGRFLGGLALGGLLGAMFMGGGFEHINFLDILVFAGIAFLLMKLLRSRSTSSAQSAAHAGQAPYMRETSQGPAGFDTDVFSRSGGVANPAAQRLSVPADFDQAAFLEGAKSAYQMMQNAWDRGDLADLRALATDKVFGELQDQIRARGNAENRTDLLKIDCELLEVRDVGSDREASVLFDVMMREEPTARPTQVREVWHFVRSRSSRQPTWYLDGIQQLED